MMKRIVALLLTLLITLSLFACSKPEATEPSADTSAAKEQPEAAAPADVTTDSGRQEIDVSVDFQDSEIRVTIPRIFFNEEMADADIMKDAEEKGYSTCLVQEDAVSLTMTKDKHAEELSVLKTDLDETIDSLFEGEGAIASYVSIDCAEDYSKVDIYVNDQFGSFDSFYSTLFYISGAYYQAFLGVSPEDIDVVVSYINNDTKEVLETGSYREYLARIESAE